jgi:hypothetical protein
MAEGGSVGMDGEAAAPVNHRAVDCQEAEAARRMGTPIQRLGSTNEKAGGLCSVGWDRKFLTIVTRPKGDAGPPHHGGPEPLHHGRQTRKIGDGERRHDGNEGGEDAREGHDAERRIRTAKCLKYEIHGRKQGFVGAELNASVTKRQQEAPVHHRPTCHHGFRVATIDGSTVPSARWTVYIAPRWFISSLARYPELILGGLAVLGALRSTGRCACGRGRAPTGR